MPEEIVNQNPTVPVSPTPQGSPIEKPMPGIRQKIVKILTFFNQLPPRSKKIILVVSAVFVILIILIFVLAAVSSRRQIKEVPAPTSTPTGFTPLESEITNPSRYATDAGVLKIETDLKNFDTRVSQEKVAEESLKLPQLDFNVTF